MKYNSVLHFFSSNFHMGNFVRIWKIVYFHIHSWKFHAKIRSRSKVINKSCFFVFLKEIADYSSIQLATLLQKYWKYLLKYHLIFFGCGALGPEFESSLRQSFNVSRVNKRRNCPFSFRAHNFFNFNISGKNFMPKYFI